VVPAVTWTGLAKVSVCHPVGDSPLKVPVASWVPVAVQSDPVWGPMLPLPL
jgi:hypothetical protein